MRRFLRSLLKDVVLQYRGGFYLVGAVVATFYIGLLRQIPSSWPLNLPLLIPLLLIVNVLVTTFYFVAALVLFERAEGTLAATAVSPLRVSEYLGAKVISLAILAIGENLAVVVFFYGTDFNSVTLIAALLLLCGFYTLSGFIAISRFDTISTFLIPSSVAITALLVPPMVFHFRTDPTGLIYLHPVQPYLSLVTAAFLPRPPAEILYGAVAGMLWLALSCGLARRAYDRLIAR